MSGKIIVWLVATTAFLATVAQAQQPGKVPLIGFLRSGSPLTHGSQNEAFVQGLRELGYVEGKNILIEYRYAEGNGRRWPELAGEMVRHKVDVIVVGGIGFTKAARQATSTIPIVATAGDLVRAGLVSSLRKPGGNVTGSTEISPDLSGKRLELLKEVVPKASRVAVLWYPTVGLTDDDEVKETQAAARQLGVKVQAVEVRAADEFEKAYAAISKQPANAIIIIQGSFTLFHRRDLVELAVKNRLPSFCESARFADEGCLVSYGADVLYLYRRAAVFVDKILKGTKPADLPVEQPTKFELVINLKTAKQIGLSIPPNMLARADE